MAGECNLVQRLSALRISPNTDAQFWTFTVIALTWPRRVAARMLSPLRARHSELSIISSLDDAPGRPTRGLLDLGLRAATLALEIDLSHLHDRSAAAQGFLSVFPGEHYMLLAALVECLQPTHISEIGTFTGLSALAMLTALPRGGKLITYDVTPWDQVEGTALLTSDFEDNRLEQRIGDLAAVPYFKANMNDLLSSSLIFVDGPKDGHFEPTFMRLLSSAKIDHDIVLVFDDIHVWNMLAFWRSLHLPKLDLTSFGHWSGTGICILSSDH